jgi:hypothetical protein
MGNNIFLFFIENILQTIASYKFNTILNSTLRSRNFPITAKS